MGRKPLPPYEVYRGQITPDYFYVHINRRLYSYFDRPGDRKWLYRFSTNGELTSRHAIYPVDKSELPDPEQFFQVVEKFDGT